MGGGHPTSRTKRIAADGTVSDDPTGPRSCSIIRADSTDHAIELAKGCPVLQGGSTIKVVETFDEQ